MWKIFELLSFDMEILKEKTRKDERNIFSYFIIDF